MFQTARGPDRDDGGLPARVRLRRLVGELSAERDVQPPVVAVVDPPDGGSGGDPPTAPPPRFTAVRRRANRFIERWVPGGGGTNGHPPGRRPFLVLCALAATAATLVSVGFWVHRPAPEPAPPLPVAAGAPSARASGGRGAHADPAPSSTAPATLVVSVVGAVATPGLQSLPDGSRVADALRAAGGAHEGVDVSGLNLARRLSDGEQITVGGTPPAEDSGPGGAPSQPLNLNTATIAQLDSLPGVGPVTAQRIVAWRTKHGSFTSVDQLAEVDGLGPARVARLKPLVRL
jgi:competence protein ComEA